jgi:hypothetical protein
MGINVEFIALSIIHNPTNPDKCTDGKLGTATNFLLCCHRHCRAGVGILLALLDVSH